MPWWQWRWHRSFTPISVGEEEGSSSSPEADGDIEAAVPHSLRRDESQVDNAFSPDVDEEERRLSSVEQQQHQFTPSVWPPHPGLRGRQYSPTSLRDVEEGSRAAFEDETIPPVRHRVIELHIDTRNNDGDVNGTQDGLSDLSTLSSNDEAQDNLENMEGGDITQASCLRIWRGLVVTKERGYICIVLVVGCVLAFDFFLQLQRKLRQIGHALALENGTPHPEHSIQWTSVFISPWLMAIYFLCRRLFDLYRIKFGTGNNNTSMMSRGLTAYFCIASASALSLGILVWLRLKGVLDSLPVSVIMTPCWVLAFFGTLLLYVSSPSLAIENMGADGVYAYEAEMSIACRLNMWIFGFQCVCIALKLDSGTAIGWSRVMLPTVLLLITAGVIIVPCTMGILMTFMSLWHEMGMSCSLAFSFVTSFTPLVVGGVVVYFGLSGLSSFDKALSGDIPATRYLKAADAMNPFLELCAALAVFLPLLKITEDNNGLIEMMTNREGFMRAADEGDESSGPPDPSPKLEPISSPMVLLRRGGEYFQQASRSIRHKLLYSPLNNTSAYSIEEKECYVCIANIADAVVLPCGHGGLCMICAKSIVKGAIEHRHCPICRAGIERVLNVGHKAIRWDSKDFIQCEDGVDIVTIQQTPTNCVP